MEQLTLFTKTLPATVHQPPSTDWARPPIASTPEVDALLRRHVPVAIGISGGKDSTVAAVATVDYLNLMGHQGPRLLIHSDLGRIEWKDSFRVCDALARYLGVELVTIRREAGDMVDRWLTRWQRNVERYTQLQCVKLILPWSTASMRFCTSELKTTLITRYLTNRFGGTQILSVTGIRRQESSKRAQKPVAKANSGLTRRTRGTSGMDWHPVIDWIESDVWGLHHREKLPIHEAYSRYGSSRVSCCNCVLASEADLMASALCPDNLAVRSELVDLEITSSFSFHPDRWLADLRPDLLTPEQQTGLATAKRIARERKRLEAKIPVHLLFSEGWPDCIPMPEEARLLADVRREIGTLMGFSMQFTQAEDMLNRYEHLLTLAQAAKARKAWLQSKTNATENEQPTTTTIQPAVIQSCIPF